MPLLQVSELSRALRVAFAAAIILVMTAAAGHSHSDAKDSPDCALCAVAHTPAVAAAAAPDPPRPEFNSIVHGARPDRIRENDRPATQPARAPPLA